MKKRLFLLLLMVLIGSLLFCACSNSSDADDEQDSSIEDSLDVSLRLGTATTGGVFFAQGTALEQLSNDISGVTIFNQATNGSGENLVLLQNGDIDLALAHNTTALPAYNGTGVYEGRPNKDFTSVGFIWFNTLHPIAAKDAGIEVIEDFAGKRMAIGTVGSAVELITSNFLSIYDMTFEDVKAQRLAIAESVDQIKNRQLDCLVHGSIIPDSNVTDMMSSGLVKILSMEQKDIDKLVSTYDMFSEAVIPAGTYPHQDEEIKTAASAAILLASPNADEEAIYRLTKAIYENNEKLMSYHNSFVNTKIDNALNGLGSIPLHPGAERYYKEAGILQ